MTKEQIISWISQFPLYACLFVIASGLLLGLLLAWIFWNRRHRAWKKATRRKAEIESETKSCESRSRYFQSKLAERQKLADEMDWSKYDFASPELAAKLKEFGVTDLKNLHSLSANQRSQLDRKFAADGLSLNWNSVDSTHASLNSALKAEVDWDRMDGVDPQAAAELKRIGITNIDELEQMSPTERTKFEAALKSKNTNWDWGKLGGWKTALSGTVAGAAGLGAGIVAVGKDVIEKSSDSLGGDKDAVGNAANATIAGTENLVSQTAGNINASQNIGFSADVDWSKVEDVDPKTAAELKAMGIKNIDELENMPPAERTEFEAVLKGKGISWDWGKLGGWKTALSGTAAGAAGLGAGIVAVGKDAIEKSSDSLGVAKDAVGDAANATIAGTENLVSQTAGNINASQNIGFSADVDWSKVEDVDPKTAAELKALGIKNIDELENMPPAERTEFETVLKSKGISWDWAKLSNWRTAVGNRSDLKGPHFNREDFQVTGFALATQEKSKSALAATNQGFDNGKSATTGAAAPDNSGTGSDTARPTSSINVDEVIARDLKNSEPPRLFEADPKWRDDLTLLDGIDDPQSRELRKMGIYNFEQLHNLPHLEQARLQSWFHSKGWHLDMDQWRISSEGNTLTPSTKSIQDKAYEVYCHRRDHHLWGDQSTDWEQAEWALRGNPVWGFGVPNDVEDFAQTMEGVTEEARDELYRMGLHNRHQVDLLNDQDRQLLTSWFAGPRFGVDLTKAFGWLSTLKPAPSHLNFGRLCDSEPNQIDDLSRINGVGNATESDLNRIGIYHFSQIADWTVENSAAVAEALGLENRIQQDSWIKQAKMFLPRKPQ